MASKRQAGILDLFSRWVSLSVVEYVLIISFSLLIFITANVNRTCRIWNVEDVKQHKGIMKSRSQNGLRAAPTSCTYSRDGNLIACACNDGSIQMWDHRKMFVSSKSSYHAHIYDQF